MTTMKNNRSTTPRIRSTLVNENGLKNSTKYKFRVQTAPPLSLKHFLRYSSGVIVGAKEWKTSGKYHEPTFRAYLSPEVRKKPVLPEPVWKPVSRYHEKPPTSLSPEKKIIKRPPEPVWQPAGKFKHDPVPYFDPPNLRWSLQELRRSMPELRPKPLHATRSASNLRKSAEVQET